MSEKIPDWYNVKYRQIKAMDGSPVKGKWKYGSLDRFSKDAKSHWPTNWCIDNAITGQPYLVPANLYEVEEIKSGGFTPSPDRMSDEAWPIFDDEYHVFVAKETNKAFKKSRKLTGCVKGKVFHTPVADGSAHYIVTNAGTRNVTIEWRNFGCDAYYDNILGCGGSFPRNIIEPIIERQEHWEKVCQESRKEKEVA